MTSNELEPADVLAPMSRNMSKLPQMSQNELNF